MGSMLNIVQVSISSFFRSCECAKLSSGPLLEGRVVLGRNGMFGRVIWPSTLSCWNQRHLADVQVSNSHHIDPSLSRVCCSSDFSPLSTTATAAMMPSTDSTKNSTLSFLDLSSSFLFCYFDARRSTPQASRE